MDEKQPVMCEIVLEMALYVVAIQESDGSLHRVENDENLYEYKQFHKDRVQNTRNKIKIRTD